MFPKLITEILATGMTEDDIGQRVSSSQASINRIKAGTQKPKYELGAALVTLHREVCADSAMAIERRGADRRRQKLLDAAAEKAA